MPTDKSPLVSCLCVSKNNTGQLQRAINCFLHQTYANKELIVIFEDNDPNTRQFMDSITHDNIRSYEISTQPKKTLGALRNIAISKSEGEYFCQWDDDDWYHESRVEMQLTATLESHKPASFLVFWLMYDMVNDQAYMSNMGPWPGTIICKKSIVTGKLRYPDLARNEDFDFMMDLINLRYVFPFIMPSLYIYTYHGRNTFDREHFDKMFVRSQRLPSHVNALFKKIFTNGITDSEASRLLMSPDFLRIVDYFHYFDKESAIRSVHPGRVMG